MSQMATQSDDDHDGDGDGDDEGLRGVILHAPLGLQSSPKGGGTKSCTRHGTYRALMMVGMMA